MGTDYHFAVVAKWLSVPISSFTNSVSVPTFPQGLRRSSEPALQCEQGDAMSISWIKDADTALSEAAKSQRPLFLDFSAAPM